MNSENKLGSLEQVRDGIVRHDMIPVIQPARARLDQDRSDARPFCESDIRRGIADDPGLTAVDIECLDRLINQPSRRLAAFTADLQRFHLTDKAAVWMV